MALSRRKLNVHIAISGGARNDVRPIAAETFTKGSVAPSYMYINKIDTYTLEPV